MANPFFDSADFVASVEASLSELLSILSVVENSLTEKINFDARSNYRDLGNLEVAFLCFEKISNGLAYQSDVRYLIHKCKKLMFDMRLGSRFDEPYSSRAKLLAKFEEMLEKIRRGLQLMIQRIIMMGYDGPNYNNIAKFGDTNRHRIIANELAKIRLAELAKQLDDFKTVHSSTSRISALEAKNYITQLAEKLFNEVPHEQCNDQTKDRTCKLLPELLEAFALKIGHSSQSQMHRNAMFFIHEHWHDIVEDFKNRFPCDKESLPNHRFESKKLPLADSNSDWHRRLKNSEVGGSYDVTIDHLIGQNPNQEANDDENEQIDKPEGLALWDYIFKAPAFNWLLATFCREFHLVSYSMNPIGQKIVQFLLFSQKIKREKSELAYSMTFRMEWDPLAFVKEQEYSEELDETVETAITLTGSARDAQALTCAQYLRQTWPSAAEHIIRLIKDVVRNGPGHRQECDFPDNTKAMAWISQSEFFVETFGTQHSIAEIGEQVAWLGAALRSSVHKVEVNYCTPFVSNIYVENSIENALHSFSGTPGCPRSVAHCNIDFILQNKEEDFEHSNGKCWHNMFKNPVVVKGYPIRRRFEPGTGLEIPLNIMAGLVRARRINTFNGSLFIKGFSAMLVPTKCSGDFLIWHLLYNKDGTRISYLENTVAPTDNISVFDLEKARHVIGWCSNVKYYAGAADAKYTIDRSGLPKPHEGCVLEKVSISGGKFVTGGFTFSIGCKDMPIHVSRSAYVPKLQWISKKFVVLWDEEDKKGWLVNGISALLHLLRASLEYNSTDKFNSVFLFKREKFQEASEQYRADSAIEVLLNSENKELEIYPEKRDYLRLEDRVEHFYDILEKIIDNQIDAAGQNGVKIQLRTRKYLEGWDFKDLATDRDPLYPHVATLQAMGRGWVDFINAINAITLFGRGFGEIFQPAHNSDSCAHWDKLPPGKCYLAACVSDLKEIMDLYGDQKSNPMKLSDKIIWYNPDKVFEPCQCNEKARRKDCDPVQVLLPSAFRNILPKVNPVQLEDHGAIVFGQNMNYKWFFPDFGNPKQEKISLSSGVSKTQSHGGRIGSSPGISAAEESTILAGTESLESSSERSTNEPLTEPSTSESARSDENVQQMPSVQGHENGSPADVRKGRRFKLPARILRNMFKKPKVDHSDASEEVQN